MNTSLPTLLALTLLTGCASIVSKSTRPVTINSTYPDTHVTIYNRAGIPVQTGEAPMTVALDTSSGYFRSAKYRIEVSRKGYPTQTSTLDAHLNPWYWGNIVFGGLIGFFIVDPATGAMWKLPDYYTAPMICKTNSVKPGGITIASINDIPVEMRAKLIRFN